MSASLAVQKALRGLLTADPTLSGMVPAGNILDAHGRPERFPSIILGEDQEVAEDATLERRHVRVFSTLHVWTREPGLAGVKAIAGAIRSAVVGQLPELDGAELIDLRFEGARFLRDPKGELAHGVVTIESLVELPQ